MNPAQLERHSMPDLSHLYERSILNVLLDSLVGRSQVPTDYPNRGCWMNLVRLTDKALVEYNLASQSLNTWIERKNQGVFSALFKGIDHFENCVVSTHRAILMTDRLRATGVLRRAPRATDRQRDQLRKIRNHIEHTDEKVSDGRIRPPEPFFLTPGQTRIELGPARLSYRDLASCITKLYRSVEVIRGAPNA
ncbi:hypothetical protein [Pseudonocardia adelaidensis]|uniref:hypothetical protein n=1 Tax=Pseudonocardia adelaidensis TaxID=648754 RepID=UPI0031E572E9